MDCVNFWQFTISITISLLHYLRYYYYTLHERCNLIHDSLGDNSNVYLDESSCARCDITNIYDMHHVCAHVRNVTTWYLEKHLIMQRDNCPTKTANDGALISLCACKWINLVFAIVLKKIKFSTEEALFFTRFSNDVSVNYNFEESEVMHIVEILHIRILFIYGRILSSIRITSFSRYQK